MLAKQFWRDKCCVSTKSPKAAGASPGSLCFAVKQEGLRFVEQELQNITVSDLHGKEGQFHYNISQVKVMDLQLAFSDLHFQPQQHLVFNISNASISLCFRRQLLYWFLKVYEFLSTFIVTGMRFLLSQQICPSLEHASLVLLNSVLDTVPVRNYVDEHIGIDYSLLRDPAVSTDTLDLDFKGVFFPRTRENQELENHAVEPVIKETERMVYVAFSEYFFDSAMHAYFQAGVLALELEGEKVSGGCCQAGGREGGQRRCHQGSSSAGINSNCSLTLGWFLLPAGTQGPGGFAESHLLRDHLHAGERSSEGGDGSPGGAPGAERGPPARCWCRCAHPNSSPQLFSLQGPLKTLLQLTIMPLINERTKKGVQIPLPEGMDFTREVVTNHAGFLTVGADLHFSKGLREVIEKYRPGPTAPAYPSPWPAEPSADPHPL
uniref:Phospholipid transfer protein n=1 Tax=Bubo bubo TaxID=30461 RepID=A0A8C0EBF5_BUBBB